MTREEAEGVAIAALGYLAAEERRLGRFLALTGLDPAALRAVATTPAFQAAVLDHLREDESSMLVFCAERGIAPEALATAIGLLAPGR